ncbi:SDR family oxidoreductase [Phenylobacterium sp. SCN 70-31]|uniref:SDR family oxidoreductase n=1 Tax=Phenylobacterium sp. SCN 70-31 TaxID=1660129 RepID=UPI00086F31D9|nr:SDR family oxidoreductase [Phenylobacterium sp. SCN 70-31]ODT88466.1 MAG: short-chain dehydrogenase/reductase [Phenylobacterium sp. SCN 70-31]
MSKTIFITGSSTGLGRATALLFAQKGWNAIATMRNPAADTELQGHGVTVMPLDVTDPVQIGEAARAALALGPVDVLFNNAGYGLAGAFEGATDDQLQDQLATNLLGVMRVTQAFLPAMRERRKGTIVTTTSIGGLVTFPFNSVYHATKWGLEGWSESLAFELAPFGVKVKTVAPGLIHTDFAGRSIVRTLHPAYMDAIGKVMATFSDPGRRSGGSTAEQIAEEVWAAVNDEGDGVTHVAGDDARALYARRLADGIDAFRKAVRTQFLGG